MIQSQICSKCVTAKWWWCLICYCGCSEGCGWCSHPEHTPLQCFTDQTSPSSKNRGIPAIPRGMLGNHPWKWVKGLGDACGAWQSAKQTSGDAEDGSMGDKSSEHWFGQTIIALAPHTSISQIGIQAFRSPTAISPPEPCSGLVPLIADSHRCFSVVLRSALHVYVG